jgi:protein-tyrosine phosphatase
MRYVLLNVTAVALCLASARLSAQQPINTPFLSTDENFRDLAGIAEIYGGTGFADTTSHDGAMRTGVFYRSENLHALSTADSATIFSTLNVHKDIDLRTPNEYQAQPDQNVPSSVPVIHINIFGTPDPPSPLVPKEDLYRGFVTVEMERDAFHTVLIELANSSGPVLYHCSFGKDRTGWTSVILQSIAGVPLETIKQDYMASNEYLGDPSAVQESWLDAALDEVAASYGTMDAYLTQPHGLGLTQADIYVLRAKMVMYETLPGQSESAGNAAAGAALLNELQDSPLSGSYTVFNYYLQSAIDAGTLGGVEERVGGQVHADAVSYLLRLPLWIDWAVAPYADGCDLCVGQRRIWVASLGDYFVSDGRAGFANSTERSGGTLVGTSYRIADPASAFLGIGYSWGSVGSADANADVNTGLATFGGRYGFLALEAGPYVAARADVGWVDYRSSRGLGGGLGIARGDTSGGVYSGRVDLGHVIRSTPLTITPQAGIRLTNASIGGFHESGSELALGVDRTAHTFPSFLADLDVTFDPRQWRGWIIEPSVDIGYELALDSPQVESTGELYGFSVRQGSAYDSWYLMRVGLGVTAQRNAVTLTSGANALFGGGASTGVVPQLSIGCKF